MNRENIYNSLLNLIGTVAEFKIKDRKLKIWSDISPADMPSLFLLQQKEVSETIRGLPIKWSFYPEIYIYVSVGNETNLNPYTLLNPILDKVCDLFDNTKLQEGNQTLGGLVHSCKINGGIETDGGILGTTAIAIIPIEIIVNN